MPADEQARRVVVEPTADEAAEFVLNLVKTIICESVDRAGACYLALAGGTTPHELYQRLARSGTTGEVPWRAVEVFFGDERDVPHDHIESNYHMVQRTLLDHLPIEPQRVHPMQGAAEDLQAAAAEYEQIIRRIVPAGEGGLPRFDLVLLGVGGDGHAASLFPDTEVLDECHKLVRAYFVPVLGRSRMTFTFPLINAARYVVMFVTGADKAEAMADMLSDDPQRCGRLPAARVRPAGGSLVVVLDGAAARAMKRNA